MPILLSDRLVAGKGEGAGGQGGLALGLHWGTPRPEHRSGWAGDVTKPRPRALCKDSAHPLDISLE